MSKDKQIIYVVVVVPIELDWKCACCLVASPVRYDNTYVSKAGLALSRRHCAAVKCVTAVLENNFLQLGMQSKIQECTLERCSKLCTHALSPSL